MTIRLPRGQRAQLGPWRFVLSFGLVSLLADMVYEGARSVIGPYLATLGASATVVGLAAGAGEFIGYGLRVVSGYLVARAQHYWAWTIVGYALTVLSVPLLGATTSLVPALLLYGAERLGKAVRSPAKDTLLSHASTRTGRGAAFGVHQAMDQFGAMLGPLVLAAILARSDGNYRLAFGALVVPGILVLAVLAWLRLRVPDPLAYEAPPPPEVPAPGEKPVDVAASPPAARLALPTRFWEYVAAIAMVSCGIASFPLLAYHAQTTGLLTTAQVPLVFALAMLVDGLTGPVVGRLYDRRGPRVLLVVPVAACAAAVAFTDSAWLVWVGIGIWGVVNGVLDSTVKAAVTELIAPRARSVAFGWLALVRGVGLLVAGGLLGAAYDRSVGLVVVLIVAANAAALVSLRRAIGPLSARPTPPAAPRP
ncbi:MAG TPA: MFS transporter [Dermatophilaceae bacterium]|nr:MFS transporter [Dermatophilaceae bacterium]